MTNQFNPRKRKNIILTLKSLCQFIQTKLLNFEVSEIDITNSMVKNNPDTKTIIIPNFILKPSNQPKSPNQPKLRSLTINATWLNSIDFSNFETNSFSIL